MKSSCLKLLMIALIIYGGYILGINQSLSKEEVKSTVLPTTSDNSTTDQTEAKVEPLDQTTENILDQSLQHQVTNGETLFLIGLKYDVLWTTIAQANNIDEHTPLEVGKTLIIPINAQGNLIKEETLNIDLAESEKTQQLVKKGEMTWRLDLIEVVKRTTPIDYHLKNDDIYTVTEKDLEQGKAKVKVEHESSVFELELTQPQIKGNEGIWYILKINSLK